MGVRHTKPIRISRRNFGMAIENSRSKELNVRWRNSLWIVTTVIVLHFNSREEATVQILETCGC